MADIIMTDDHSSASTAYTTIQVMVPRQLVRGLKDSKSILKALPKRNGKPVLTRKAISVLQQQLKAVAPVATSSVTSAREVRALLLVWREHDLHSTPDHEPNQLPVEKCTCHFCDELRDLDRLLGSRLGYNVKVAYIPETDCEVWVKKQIRLFFDYKPTSGNRIEPPFSILFYGGHGGIENDVFAWYGG